jgi:predicted dienelactone hydrolase
MRTLEALLWLIASGWAVWWWVRPPGRLVNLLFAPAALLAAALHVTIEGIRFHMVPTYALLPILVALAIWNPRKPRTLLLRLVSAIPLCAWIVAAYALPALFPVYRYDAPSGPYAVGTADYELRREAGNRDLVVQAWYPIVKGTKGAAAGITSRPEVLKAAFASFTGLPQALFDNLRLIQTHAIRNVALARGRDRFPVVLFSHGPGSANRSQSIFQMEELASRGFIVIAIDHAGYASTTIFPDGHAVPLIAGFAWPVFVDARSQQLVRTWLADLRFVLDRLQDLDRRDPAGLLTARLDLSRVGYLGASFGGSVVVQALAEEPRIRAGIAQDGKPYFFENAAVVRRPLMYMQSADPYIASSDAQLAKWGITSREFKLAEQDHYARQMQLFSYAQAPIYNVFFRGTDHLTFSDLYLVVRLPGRQLIDIRQAHRMINRYTFAFFDRYLNGIPEQLTGPNSPSPYPGVTVASRNVPAAEMLSSTGTSPRD